MTGMFGTCPKCGVAYPVGVAFCSRCGQPLDGVNASPPPRWRRPIRAKTVVLVAVGVLVIIGTVSGAVSALSSSGGDEADTNRAAVQTTTTAPQEMNGTLSIQEVEKQVLPGLRSEYAKEGIEVLDLDLAPAHKENQWLGTARGYDDVWPVEIAVRVWYDSERGTVSWGAVVR